MLRKIIVMTAASLLLSAAAHAKPGEYAKDAKVLHEYSTNCDVAVTGDAATKDEVAHALEKLKVTDPERYAKRVCKDTESVKTDEEPAAEPDARAETVPPAPAPMRVAGRMVRSTRGGCPNGSVSMGRFGCAGPTIRDPKVLAGFRERIGSHCVPGRRKTEWRTGVDAQGRKVRWKITFHTECD